MSQHLAAPRWAPKEDVGRPKIIPNRGPHDILYPSHEQYTRLVRIGLIRYEPEYGPHARVYRPILPADTATVMAWLDGDTLKRFI